MINLNALLMVVGLDGALNVAKSVDRDEDCDGSISGLAIFGGRWSLSLESFRCIENILFLRFYVSDLVFRFVSKTKRPLVFGEIRRLMRTHVGCLTSPFTC